MMKTTISRSSRLAIATVGAMLAPTFAIGQDSTAKPRTHVVRKGDTLWDIARTYTNDPSEKTAELRVAKKLSV